MAIQSDKNLLIFWVLNILCHHRGLHYTSQFHFSVYESLKHIKVFRETLSYAYVQKIVFEHLGQNGLIRMGIHQEIGYNSWIITPTAKGLWQNYIWKNTEGYGLPKSQKYRELCAK